MPWQFPNDVPNSKKYLKPSIQKKAIAIANHILETTGDEGKAIAIGISKAKSVHDKKGLIKMAALRFKAQTILKFNNFMKNNNKNYHKLVHKLKQRYDNESR